MDILINEQELRKALSFLKPAISTRSLKPVLLCVHIDADAENNSVALRATSLDAHMEYTVAAGVDQGGRVLVPFKELLAASNMASGCAIQIFGNDKKVTASWAEGQIEMEAYDPAEFPMFPPTGKEIGTVDAKLLSSMLFGVSFAASKKTYQGRFSNINLSCKDGKLESVATDGDRLAVMKDTASLKDFDYLIPANMASIFKELSGPTELSIYEMGASNELPFLHALNGPRKMAIQLGHVCFPKWKDIVPEDTNETICVEANGNELARSVAKAVMEQENCWGPRISVSVSPDGINLSSGKLTHRFPASATGKIKITFNPTHLAEGLSFINGLATISIFKPNKPIKITNSQTKQGFFTKTGPKRMYLLMPCEE